MSNGQGCVRREEGGGGSGNQRFVYQKWPDKIFRMVNFVFPTLVTSVLGGEGGKPRSSYGVRPFEYFPGNGLLSKPQNSWPFAPVRRCETGIGGIQQLSISRPHALAAR